MRRKIRKAEASPAQGQRPRWWLSQDLGPALPCSEAHTASLHPGFGLLLRAGLSPGIIPCPAGKSVGDGPCFTSTRWGSRVKPRGAGLGRWWHGGDRSEAVHPPRKVPEGSNCVVGGQDSGGANLPLTCLCLPFPTEERRAREWPVDSTELPEGRLEDWLEKRAKRLSSAPSSRYRPCGPPLPCPLGARPQPACLDRKVNNLHALAEPR